MPRSGRCSPLQNAIYATESVAKQTEMALVRLACDGDSNAYWHLVRPHLRLVLLTAQTILMNSADAEEVAQESLLKGLSKICQFRRKAKFSTWLLQNTINESRQRLRKYRKHLHRTLEEMTASDESETGCLIERSEIPLEVLQRKELKDALQFAIASLPQKYRGVLTLRDIDHLNNKETAQVLGLTQGTVKIRLLRARRKIRDLLTAFFDGSQFEGKR